MNTEPHHALDVATASALVSTPLWWNSVNFYGQVLLLALGITIGLLRLAVAIRDYRRKA